VKSVGGDATGKNAAPHASVGRRGERAAAEIETAVEVCRSS
jgi:hypothetical protein